MKIAICTMAKNEEKYIEDWILYHYMVGFNSFTIYDNNSPEHKGRLKHKIDISNKLTTEMKDMVNIIDVTDKTKYQDIAFTEYYTSGDFDWCIFLDVDEFVTPIKWKTISEMLSANEFSNTFGILLGRENISDDDIVDVPDNFIYNGKLAKNIRNPSEREHAADTWESIPVYARFSVPSKNSPKSMDRILIRKGIKGIRIRNHVFYTDAKPIIKNTMGETIIKNKVMITASNDNLDTLKEYAYIRHYRTKTIREFLNSKYTNKSTANKDTQCSVFISDYFFRDNSMDDTKNNYINTHKKPVTCVVYKDDAHYEMMHDDRLSCIIDIKKRYTNERVISWHTLVKKLSEIDYVYFKPIK